MTYREPDYKVKVQDLEEELERVREELWFEKRDNALKRIEDERRKKDERRQRIITALKNPFRALNRVFWDRPWILLVICLIVLGSLLIYDKNFSVPRSVPITYEGQAAFRVDCKSHEGCQKSAKKQCAPKAYYTLNYSTVHVPEDVTTMIDANGMTQVYVDEAHDEHMLIYSCELFPSKIK